MKCSRHAACTFPLLTDRLPVPFQRTPYWFPILGGGFHDHFLDLLLDEPFRQCSQLLRVAPVPALLKLVLVVDFHISHNHSQLLFVYIDSRYPIRHGFPPGGSGERAGLTLNRVAGYRRSHRGETTHHLFAL